MAANKSAKPRATRAATKSAEPRATHAVATVPANNFSVSSGTPRTGKAQLFNEVAIERFTNLFTPEDTDMVLKRAKLCRADLRRLETDDEVSGALETRRDAVMATPWRLDGKKGKVLDFVNKQIETNFQALISGAWGAVPYGYSVIEATYERVDGRICFAKVEAKPIEWFTPRRDGVLVMNVANGSVPEEVDSTFKFFLTRSDPSYRQPYGEALLSKLYWPWVFRHGGWELWAKFVDRHGDPLITAKTKSPKAWVQAMTEMGYANLIAVGATDEVKVESQGGSEIFEKFDGVLSRRIQKMVLGQTLTSDNANGGSNALGKVHNLVRMDKRDKDIVLVSATIQRMIDALWALNKFGGTPPRFVMEDGKGIEAERATRDASLAKSGVVKFTKAYLLRTYGFEEGDIVVPDHKASSGNEDPSQPKDPNDGGDPVTDDELDEVVEDAAAPKAKASKPKRTKTSAGGSPALAFASGRKFTADQQQVEDAGVGAEDRMGSPIDVALIREAVLASTDTKDLTDRLSVLMQDAKPEAFSKALGSALFVARVLGFVHATQEA